MVQSIIFLYNAILFYISLRGRRLKGRERGKTSERGKNERATERALRARFSSRSLV